MEEGTTERSLEQILDLDWGIQRPEVESTVRRMEAAARNLLVIAEKQYGVDPESIPQVARLLRAADRTFPTGPA